MVEAGQKAETFLHNTINNVVVEDVQADEIWAFIQCKQKTAQRLGKG
jgi:predicted NAD-dependent protein-ADP-ribosyltransferase YbiA (DUF1768 family)